MTFYMFPPSQYEKWTFASSTGNGILIEFVVLAKYYYQDCLKIFDFLISVKRQVFQTLNVAEISKFIVLLPSGVKKSEKIG